MRAISMGLAAAVFLAPSAGAGIVTFEPPATRIHQGDPGNAALTVDVCVMSETGGFDALDMLIGSEVVALVGFRFSEPFIDATMFRAVSGDVGGSIYPHTMYAGGFGLPTIATNAPILVGTLVFDATELTSRVHTLVVDSGRDDARSALTLLGVHEPLEGAFSLYVVSPEPASLTLVGLGVLGLFRVRGRQCHSNP